MKNTASKKKTKSTTKTKKYLIIGTIVFVALVGSATVYIFTQLSGGPSPVGKSDDENRAFVRSAEFKKFSDVRQISYMHKAFMQSVNDRADKFQTLPPQERTVFLDKIIDDLQQLRNDANIPRPFGIQPGRGGPERIRQIAETLSPQQRVKAAALLSALVNRMQQRGVPKQF